MRIPDGKLSNVFAFLQFLNCLWLGNMSIVQDTMALIDDPVQDLYKIISADYDEAATTLVSLGAI